MPRIAVTGHMNLTPESGRVVRDAMVDLLGGVDVQELVGISCLARGADSVFAQAVIDVGGVLEVVLPSANYRETKVKPDHARRFDDLLARAGRVRIAPFAEANRDAYEAANEIMLGSCDILYAVWDGQTGVDKGSTSSVVEAARARGIPVEVIWPEGAKRESP